MAVTVKEILAAMDHIAPFALTMDFDNTGLLIGDPAAEVTGVLLALDCTDQAVRQAKALGANLILTHHPVIFSGLKRITAGSVVYDALRSGLNVISAHTNLDIAAGGVNDCLAQRLGLSQISGLTVTNRKSYEKVVVFVPKGHEEAVYRTMTAAGAGTIGDYAGCAYFTQGEGTFLPLEGTHPFIGTAGQQEYVPEVRIEMICPAEKTAGIVAAMKAAHPYEVPAYDIFPDKGLEDRESLGRVGLLPHPMEPRELAAYVKEQLGGAVRFTQGAGPITKVAVCGGSGDSELESAFRAGAQAMITGEVKHHLFVECDHRNFTMVEAGHFHTEAVVLEPLKQRLVQTFPQIFFAVCDDGFVHTI